MIPMGTVVTVCMLVGLLYALMQRYNAGVARAPGWLHGLAAAIVGLAGVWNTFWYGLQHLSEFWGLAALFSGIFMMLTAIGIYQHNKDSRLTKLQPVVLLGLAGSFVLYAVTIYRL